MQNNSTQKTVGSLCVQFWTVLNADFFPCHYIKDVTDDHQAVREPTCPQFAAQSKWHQMVICTEVIHTLQLRVVNSSAISHYSSSSNNPGDSMNGSTYW